MSILCRIEAHFNGKSQRRNYYFVQEQLKERRERPETEKENERIGIFGPHFIGPIKVFLFESFTGPDK